MTLGRTSSNAIKIKTDGTAGLRAVECACCGGECKRFLLSLLGLSFEVSLVNLPYPQPFDENDGRGLRCVYTGGASAGDITLYRSGVDLYCEGGYINTFEAYTGGEVVVELTHFISEGIVNLKLFYTKSLDPAGTRECIQAFFCTKGTETQNLFQYDGPLNGFEFPSQTGTYSIPVTQTESHNCCPWAQEPPPPEECETISNETTIAVLLEII